MTVKQEDKLLSTPELLEELKKRGIDISRVTLYFWIKKGKIPKKFYTVKKRLERQFYYFKPELVEFLTQKLSSR
ncbi:helix-turn-helix transcriptional regulator [Aquifex aeolicus]|uniref:helix-turn-helix transcriptional regulator n=1 Tax=Aquifex aeolicus TaxID=63363 RepID=UPI0002DDF828|nr:S-adenosylmethionine:tRNA ribosyltransferase-isomerase [Aquifex aeolicus]